MSRHVKRAKLEVGHVGRTAAAAEEEEEDPTLAIAAFMAPSFSAALKQPDSPPRPSSPNADDSSAVGSSEADSLHLSTKKKGLAATGEEAEDGTTTKKTAATKGSASKKKHVHLITDEERAAAAAAAKAKARSKRKKVVTTQRLSYMAQHGFIHSSLPLLSSLTRERLLEHSFASASESLQRLYPAYRLDVDTIFKASVEILEKQHARGEHARGGEVSQNQLTRFYRKIMNLHPKNLIQVVFELSYLFLSASHLEESFDHLSSWSQSYHLTHSGSAVHEHPRALRQMQGLLGVLAWECARRAHKEAEKWRRRLQRRQDGDEDDDDDDESDDDSIVAHRASHTLSLSRAQSTADLLLEVRTSQQKVASFEKTARARLRAAVHAEPADAVWLWYYLECMNHFYNAVLPTEDPNEQDDLSRAATAPPGGTSNVNTAAAPAARATHSAAKNLAHTNRTKLAALQQRLLRKIDEYIVASSAAAASGPGVPPPPPGPTGFHLKLHYLDVFRSRGSGRASRGHHLSAAAASAERTLVWTMTRQLLRADPTSNLGMTRAWRLWREQGETDEDPPVQEEAPPLDLTTSGSVAPPAPSTSRLIRAIELVDIFAARLDLYPDETRSWHALARLLVAALRLAPSSTHIAQWPLAMSASEEEEMRVEREELAKAVNAAAAAAAATAPPPQPPTRVDSAVSDSDHSDTASSASTPRLTSTQRPKRLHFPDPLGSDSVPASPALTASTAPSSPAVGGMAAPALPPQRSNSIMSSSNASSTGSVSDAASQLGSLISAGSDLGGGGGGGLRQPPKVFAHNHPNAAPPMRDAERHAAWLGRIEWWVQADGWWRGVKHLKPTEAPNQLPNEPEAQSRLLRAVCYGLVLQWMGWLK